MLIVHEFKGIMMFECFTCIWVVVCMIWSLFVRERKRGREGKERVKEREGGMEGRREKGERERRERMLAGHTIEK